MAYASKIKQQISRYVPADRAALVEFQQRMFGPGAFQSDEDQFRWLFEDNPYRPAEGPEFWLCKKDGKVVGQQAGIPFELKVGARCYRASWAIDLIVDPRWRLRGVGPVLSETYTERNALIAGMGISDLAYKAFLRAGWKDLGDLPLYVRPLDVPRMLKNRPSSNPLAHVVAKAAHPLVRLADAAGEGAARWRNAVLEPIERFDVRVDGLWAAARERYAVIARRDYQALRWRFDMLPDPSRYERFYLMEEGRLRGYAVVCVGRRHGAMAGIIVDYLAMADWARPLFARCVEHLRRAGSAAVYCTTLNRHAERELYPLGFVRRESGSHFMIRLGSGPGPDVDTVATARNWFITLADSDADFAWRDEPST